MLARVCERLKPHQQLRNTLGVTTSDISFLFRRFVEPDEKTHHANRFNLVYELQRARHLRFTDDRDRVFAFLGHYSVRSEHPLSCGPVSITADYTKTVEQTYVHVAVQILRANAGAVCILLAAVQHNQDSLPSQHVTNWSLKAWLSNEHTLPSWVPDWRRYEGIILAEPICPHHAHSDSAAKLEIIGRDNPLLRIHGVKIDTIEACSRQLLAMDFYREQSPDQPRTMIEQLWQSICGKGPFNLREEYLNGQTAFVAFMQTLSNGCVQAAGHACQPYHEIPDNEWLQRGARYVVQALGTSDDVLDDVQEAAGKEEHVTDQEEWSRWAASASEGRVFARTQKGYYVLGPAALEPGDLVCVLFGCKVPFCLRPMGEWYLLVGECYVHGLMKGEALGMFAQDELRDERFDIL
jgi:hypothetical protein